MRHRHNSRRLSQKAPMARMILRNLLTSILLYEDVRTTKKRAQVVRPMVDQMITIAKKKRPDVAIREINMYVTDRNACRKLMEVMKQRYADRSSGFTSMKPAGMRKGDGAALVDISFVEGKEVTPVEKKPKVVKEKAPKKSAPVSKKK